MSVVTFGEVMLRLSAPGHERLAQARNFEAHYGGTEANVAVGLAGFGVPTKFVSRFPDNALGHAARDNIRAKDVDTQHVQFGGERIGVYFLEHGASLRASQIVYDRYHSAFATLEPADFDWNEILKNARWFHWAANTPAISEKARIAVAEAVKTANKLGLTVSGDIYARNNLWHYGKTAREVLPELLTGTDLVLANAASIEEILGIDFEKNTENQFVEAAKNLARHFPKIKKVADTERISHSASHNELWGFLWNGREYLESRHYDLTPIVDRIGSGDAFLSGLIYGLLTFENDDRRALEFGAAAAAWKHTIPRDMNVASVREIEAILAGDTSGRLRR